MYGTPYSNTIIYAELNTSFETIRLLMTTLIIDIDRLEPQPVDPIVEEQNQEPEKQTTNEFSAMHIPIEIYGIGTEPFEAKVDTGAQCCSLGATDIKCDGELVEFTINGRRYRTACVGMQNIQTSNGTEDRPVIEVNCKVKGSMLRKVQFNLNDRSDLEDQILLGMNLLNHLDLNIDSHEETHNPD